MLNSNFKFILYYIRVSPPGVTDTGAGSLFVVGHPGVAGTSRSIPGLLHASSTPAPRCVPQGNNITPHTQPHLRTTELVNPHHKWGWKSVDLGAVSGQLGCIQSLQGTAVGARPHGKSRAPTEQSRGPRVRTSTRLASGACMPACPEPSLPGKRHPPQLGDLSGH